MGMEHDFSGAMSKLEEMEKKVARGISDNALKAGGKVLLRHQEVGAPVDSGDLKQSLLVGKPKGGVAKRKVLVGIDPTRADEMRYGYYQEHGTSVMLGKKWMKKSYQRSKDEAMSAISQSLADEIGGN